jgi:glutamate synthase (NADPH/NADH) small chain
MGKVTGFKEFNRENFTYDAIEDRIKHYKEFTRPLDKAGMTEQGARCMDCGVPFCHSSYGCPLGNTIPQFNDQVYRDKWENAFRTLMSTNNFPEFTGRVCPAICETACVLGINEDPVTIKNLEVEIIEKAYRKGWMKPQPPKKRTGKSVAVVGSGPAGLSAANQLNKAGHTVTVFEKQSRIGGLVRYGIPNFKLDKKDVVQKRVELMKEEGIEFITDTHIGVDIALDKLQNDYDAVVLSCGAEQPRDLPIPNRDANGIYFAMEFLGQNNSRVEGENFAPEEEILATDKHVIVIGGGDTGSDCVGTSVRQGAKSITQIELLSKPPLERNDSMPWPHYPRIFRLSTSQAEGLENNLEMMFDVLSKEFVKDANGNVKELKCVKIEWGDKGFTEIEGSEFTLKADLVLLAMGFLGPIQEGLVQDSGLETDNRSNVIADKSYKTSKENVFACGDMRRGQSLVVWAIYEGRECAIGVDEFLMQKSSMLNKRSSSLFEFRS